MRAAFLITLAFSTASFAQGRFDRFNARTAQGRSTRGFEQSNYAFFEFAPASGTGMGTACACAAITGAKGEAVTLTRASDATCSKQGLATTGIANGDLVVCTANQPRVEPLDGVLAVRYEGTETNVLLRFINPCDAVYTDVGTPALTGQVVSGTSCATTTPQTSPWAGTYANAAVQFDDNDGAAFEGRAQTVTVTAATKYTMCCYVKAGTLASARLSLDGTTADVTGLSSSTWTLASVTDASSSGVAVSAQILNGSTAASTGTVIWGGCHIETGSYCTSMQPTEAAAAGRAAEPAYSDLGAATGGYLGASGGSVAVTARCLNSTSGRYLTSVTSGGAPNVEWDHWYGATASTQWAAPGVTNFNSTLARDSVSRRWVAAVGASGSNFTLCRDGTCESGSARGPDASGATNTRVYMGNYSGGSFYCDGLISRVCVDPSPTRCR